MQDVIDAWLADASYIPTMRNIILMSLSVNDMSHTMPDSAAWYADYKYMIDAIKTKYTNAEFYLSYPWSRSYSAVECPQMKRWIDVLIATYPSYVFAGDDENVWCEGGDNGATMTTDGVHYSVAGNAAKLTQIRTILGF